MLTRRENLLIRPWQERRYINHRKKVEHALPAIDVKPPPRRAHVTCKLKKLQKEAERCARIEQDNFTLLQHLRSIMHSSRVDNVWDEAPPNFLHRVGIYCSTDGEGTISPQEECYDSPTNRKERCLACSPHRIEKRDKIPEERIPWDPPRPRLSRRQSESVAAIISHAKKEKTDVKEINQKKQHSTPSSTSLTSTGKPSRKTSTRSRTSTASSRNRLTITSKADKFLNDKTLPDIETQSIILSRGALKLSVSFPPHTTVVLKDGEKEKVLQSEYCHCKAMKHTCDNKSI